VVDEIVDEIMNHLFILNFHNLKRKKNKRCEKYKGFFLEKKMGPKSPCYEEKNSKVMFDLVYKKGFNLCIYGCKRPR
jgi:hypothetical protein